MKNLIVTFHQKKYNSFLSVVEERFKKYAAKYDCDFLNVEIPPDTPRPLLYKFFYIGKNLPKAKRYMVIDLDIIIKNNSPNIFDIVPYGHLGMYMETGTFHTYSSINEPEISIRWQLMVQLMKECDLEILPMQKTFFINEPFKYYNNGVVIYDSIGLEVHNCLTSSQIEKVYKCEMPCIDQTLLNYCIRKTKTKVYHLPVCFNQMPYNRTCDYKETAFFSHYAGLQSDIKSNELLADNYIWSKNGY